MIFRTKERCVVRTVTDITYIKTTEGFAYLAVVIDLYSRRVVGKPRSEASSVAAAESFFSLLKRERIRRRTYKTRDEARQDVFDYIQMFYNPQRRHVRNGMLSPVEFEKLQKLNSQGV